MQITKRSLIFVLIMIAAAWTARGQINPPPYRDVAQPVEQRVEDLLRRMTLKEKVGQLNMPCVYVGGLGRTTAAKSAACRKLADGTYTDQIGPIGGFFVLAYQILPEGNRQQAEYFNDLQKIAIEKTRLGIPLEINEEGTHGAMCSGKTIFPEGLGLGSTFDMDLFQRLYATAAREARAVGIHRLNTLVVEPNRDPRMGRNEEGYSEDPYLCSRIAEAIVHGMQGDDVSAPDKVIAGLCHYPGQGQPVSGLERGAMEISERTLRNVFLPPWVAGVKRAGALGVMATFPAIDGVPVHASPKILTDILRGELGFKGVVLSEGGGIDALVACEHIAPTEKAAGQMALHAGVDVGISYEPAFMGLLVQSVNEGQTSVADLDRAVRRVLRQKFDLGLFEHPYVDVERAVETGHSPAAQNLALQAAREGIVLLKNNGLLPLKKDVRRIAVIGPNADNLRNQLGDYTSPSILQEVTTVLAGIRQRVSPETTVRYARGCEVTGTDRSGFAEAVAAAKNADVAVVVVGERQSGRQTTDGEGYDVADLDLTGVQEDLVEAVYNTGTPTVVVLINGRPLSVRWIAANIPALVEAWSPGERGGRAVAEILFGDVNPSGRLPITVPRHSGQLLNYYDYPPSKAWWTKVLGRQYVDMSASPLYAFGHGLSYTTFEYSNLRIDPPEIGPAGEVRVSLDVRNTGARQGDEVVQLYLNDEFASVSRPVKELRRFERIGLAPGQTRTVQFVLTPEDLSLLDRDLRPVVEPGAFKVMIGRASDDIRLNGGFAVR